jgi:hypothetical protein
MKTFDCVTRIIAASGAVWLTVGFSAHAVAGPGAPGMATVVRVSGNARCSEDRRMWRSLKKGERLKPGTLIQTAELSTVDLVLGESEASGSISISLDGIHGDDLAHPLANTLRVVQNSVLGLEQLPDGRPGSVHADETQLDLQGGEIYGSVERMPAGSKYEIKLPKGIAGIRGSTRFMVSSSGAARAKSGSLVIVQTGADGSLTTKVVAAGQKFDPNGGVVVEASVQEGNETPIKLGSDSARSIPGSNPAAPPGPTGDFSRSLPSRRF